MNYYYPRNTEVWINGIRVDPAACFFSIDSIPDAAAFRIDLERAIDRFHDRIDGNDARLAVDIRDAAEAFASLFVADVRERARRVAVLIESVDAYDRCEPGIRSSAGVRAAIDALTV